MLKVTVIHRSSGQSAQFQACADEPLLDQLERECPFAIPNLCWMGACGTCALKVTEGIEHLESDAFGVGATIPVDPGYILPCAAGAREGSIRGSHPCHVLVEVA